MQQHRSICSIMTTAYTFELSCQVFGTQDAPDLLYWVANRLEADAKLLLIDLKEVESIDSSGVGTLMIAKNRAKRVGAHLGLCNVSEEVMLQIEQANLISKFEVYSDLADFKATIQRQEQ